MKRTLEERKNITEYYELYGCVATQRKYGLTKSQVKEVARWYRKTKQRLKLEPKHILDDTLDNICKAAVTFALNKHKGNKAQASKALGMSRRGLEMFCKRHNIVIFREETSITKEELQEALKKSWGDVAKTAALLDITQSHAYQLVCKYDLIRKQKKIIAPKNEIFDSVEDYDLWRNSKL